MEHYSHEHALILNEKYIARDGDICRGCGEQIFSSKSFIYSCSRIISGASPSTHDDKSCADFLLHKNCAELPKLIQILANPQQLFHLCFDYSNIKFLRILETANFSMECYVCDIEIPWNPKRFFYYGVSKDYNRCVCLNCVMLTSQLSLGDRKFKHPAHDRHPLSLIQQPSSFKCHACNVEDNIKDMSYRCTVCQFWMHKSCAQAPASFEFRFHDKHPLILLFSLPQVYRKFDQYCGICSKRLSRLVWLYCCRKCRFFAHFQCARSFNGILNSCENEKYDSEVEQLPAPDESSVNLLFEKFIKAKSIQNNNNGSICSSVQGIEHWTHEEHLLKLINGNVLQDVDKSSLLCDGCVQPIRTDEDQFYGCVICKYFMHEFCAQLPKEIKLNIGPAGSSVTLNARKHIKPYRLFYCRGCGDWGNGIFFNFSRFDFHIGCLSLPKTIKHEAHRHKLEHIFLREPKVCKACHRLLIMKGSHKCQQCDYHICDSCVMKASVVNHPWDLHPLRLIYESGMIMDHEHEFNCEVCSNDIDANYWFYHCSDCDLSFHLNCFDKSRYQYCSSVKFGATDIVIDKLHRHGLTFVLNKKFRKCEGCHKNQIGETVLECDGPCRSIFCRRCALTVL